MGVIRIINHPQQPTHGYQLHIGSGSHPMRGWVNVDLDPSDGPDVVADAFCLCFPAAVFERVYIGHVLEHLRWEDLPSFGDEMRRVCQPDAEVMVVGPDITRGVETEQPAELLHSIIGEPDPDEGEGPGCHQWVATERLTRRAMERCGFVKIESRLVSSVAPPEWPNPAAYDSWQCALEARIPS